MGKTAYLSDLFLNAALTHGSFTGPAQLYVALNTTLSTPSTPGAEVTDVNYGRVAVTWGAMLNGSATASTVGGAGNFFGVGLALSVTVVEIAIYDSPVGGNELYYATLPSGSVTLNAGDTTSLNPFHLTLSESGKGNALSDALATAYLRNGSYTGPLTLYAALNTTSSTPTTPGTEVVDTAYSRQVITFGAASGGLITSPSLLNFFGTGATSSHDVVEIAIYDAPTGGNEMYYGPLTTSKMIRVGETSKLPMSHLNIQECTQVSMLGGALLAADAVVTPTFVGVLGATFSMGGHISAGL